jgi:hypothetical protein
VRSSREIGVLSLYGAGRHVRPGLKVIRGNPLAVRENPDRAQRQLTLVWNQPLLVAPRVKKVPLQTSPEKWHRKTWRWLNDNGPALGVILVAVPMMLGAVWVVFSAYSRLGQLEEKVNGKEGKGGLVDQVGEISKQLAVIGAKLESIDKYVLQQLKPKAEMLLGTPDVEVFRVLRNEVATNASFSVPYSNPQAPKETFLTYTIEGIREGFLIVRAQVEEEMGGKVVRSLYDRHIQIRLPSEVGKHDSYCFKFSQGGSETEPNWIGPPVCIEVALLERTGPDNLIFASAVKPEATS